MLITPPGAAPGPLLETTEAALRGGARCVQLRDKQSPSRALVAAARGLRALTRRHGALLLVNGRVDVAAACEADGVHLGKHELPPAAARRLLGPGALVGYSAHRGDAPADYAGADYVSYSPVYASPGKGEPAGTAGLAAFAAAGAPPIVALGGVTAGRVGELLAAGAWGVAVIREIYDAPDACAVARAVCAEFERESHGTETHG